MRCPSPEWTPKPTFALLVTLMPAYDFGRLFSFDFEVLVGDLLRADWNVDLEVFTPGRDTGIDLRAFSDSKRETIVQCKHMPNASFSKLFAHPERRSFRRYEPSRQTGTFWYPAPPDQW
jgi:restriction endonuclease